MSRTRIARALIAMTLAAGLAACEDDEGAAPAPDAGRDGGGDTASPDGGDAGGGDRADTMGDTAGGDASAGEAGGDAGPDASADGPPALTDQQKRGQYLVDVVLSCGDCHTPRTATGPDMTKYLAGISCFFDVVPATAGMGCISSKNLTNHETGLKNVSDQGIKDMFTKGVRPDAKAVHSAMPYYEYANVKPADADAVVAYLRTVKPVDFRPAANEPPFAEQPAAPVALVSAAAVPMPTTPSDSAMRGRDIVMVACIGCHTPEKAGAGPTDLPLDATKFLAGGRGFPAAAFGLPVPPFPAMIYTQNLTQDATGLQGWTADDVVKALKMGLDKMDKKVCPPMPSGPMGSFKDLTEADARDIANYIAALPAVANALPNQCTAP
jgi:mono/diheme cytochrome c family protein